MTNLGTAIQDNLHLIQRKVETLQHISLTRTLLYVAVTIGSNVIISKCTKNNASADTPPPISSSISTSPGDPKCGNFNLSNLEGLTKEKWMQKFTEQNQAALNQAIKRNSNKLDCQPHDKN